MNRGLMLKHTEGKKYLKTQLLGLCTQTKKIWEKDHKSEAEILRWLWCWYVTSQMVESNNTREWVETLINGQKPYPKDIPAIITDLWELFGDPEDIVSSVDELVNQFTDILIPR